MLFVDVAKIGGHDRLVTYEPGRLNWFDPESAAEQELVQVTSNFSPPRKSEIPHVDVTHDLNGDERDDLVVYSLAGRRISSKQSTYEVHFGMRAPDGSTAFPSEIGATFQSKRRIQLGMNRHDFDRDGQVDLMLTASRSVSSAATAGRVSKGSWEMASG